MSATLLVAALVLLGCEMRGSMRTASMTAPAPVLRTVYFINARPAGTLRGFSRLRSGGVARVDAALGSAGRNLLR